MSVQRLLKHRLMLIIKEILISILFPSKGLLSKIFQIFYNLKRIQVNEWNVISQYSNQIKSMMHTEEDAPKAKSIYQDALSNQVETLWSHHRGDPNTK